MELYRLHVPQRDDARIEGDGHSGTLIDDGVGGMAVDASVATGSDDRSPGQIGAQLTITEVSHYGAVAPVTIMDEGQGLYSVVNLDPELQGHVVHGVEQGVPCAVGAEASSPLLGAAEGAGGDKAFLLI